MGSVGIAIVWRRRAMDSDPGCENLRVLFRCPATK